MEKVTVSLSPTPECRLVRCIDRYAWRSLRKGDLTKARLYQSQLVNKRACSRWSNNIEDSEVVTYLKVEWCKLSRLNLSNFALRGVRLKSTMLVTSFTGQEHQKQRDKTFRHRIQDRGQNCLQERYGSCSNTRFKPFAQPANQLCRPDKVLSKDSEPWKGVLGKHSLGNTVLKRQRQRPWALVFGVLPNVEYHINYRFVRLHFKPNPKKGSASRKKLKVGTFQTLVDVEAWEIQ